MQEPRLLIPLRVAFITCICATLVTSLMYLSHVRICKPSGEPCFNFEGAIQFSTFTRWSWMSEACAQCAESAYVAGCARSHHIDDGATALDVLQGVYYLGAVWHSCGAIPRAARGLTTRVLDVLFGVSFAAAIQEPRRGGYCAGRDTRMGLCDRSGSTASSRLHAGQICAGTAARSRILVAAALAAWPTSWRLVLVQTTVITYSILVPVALLVRDSQPAHQQGAFEILLSPQGHIMHSLNTGKAAPFCGERPAPLLRASMRQCLHTRAHPHAPRRTRTNARPYSALKACVSCHVLATVPVTTGEYPSVGGIYPPAPRHFAR